MTRINQLSCSIPRKCYLAFSGGADSLGALGFLLQGRREVELLHFNHGTELSHKIQKDCEKIAGTLGLKIHVDGLPRHTSPPLNQSLEEWWRECRYGFLDRFDSFPVITAHHLDDCVETHVFNSLHGKAGNIGVTRGNVIRPFLGFRGDRLRSFIPEGVEVSEDLSNNDLRFMRNRIRHRVIPELLQVNPGLHKVVLRSLDV